MNKPKEGRNHRILVVDDNRAIHGDFRKILCGVDAGQDALNQAEALLFDGAPASAKRPVFEIESAYQGKEALALVEKALQEGRPYALAFVDVRMPPGWDGVETAAKIWEVYPDLQIVICTAYSDYSWEEMEAKLGNSDQLLILKKPFDTVEVLQMACALTEKWALQQQARTRVDELEKAVRDRTRVLEETNSQLHEQATLLDLAGEAIFVRDLEGRLQFWNRGAERLYGWAASEAIGRSMKEIFPRRDVVPFGDAEKKLLDIGEWNGEIHDTSKSGVEVIADSRWTLVRDEQGNPRSVLVINTDITEKKKLEAQFLRSQRMEGIGTLATGMAHDLNNILAPILMSAGALRWDLTPKDHEVAISRIEMSVKRAADIIQQVLTFGRGVSGERVPINPADLMGEVLKIMEQTFPKNITTTLEAGPGLRAIVGDKTQIHQVLLNLCINARDAMPSGGKIVLRAENIMVDEKYAVEHTPLPPGPYVMVRVIDTGCGISPANIETIFDPFFTTKEFGKGTGLGLSTVLGIVKSHHGSVTVESELNRGTTFTVLLPTSSKGEKAAGPAIAATPLRAKGEIILLVDDEENIVSATRRMLEQFGYKTLDANNGKEALAIISHTEGIDLVLTDIMMPQMDGLALIRELRESHPQIKIIASSGLGANPGGSLRKHELESLGVKSFLPKPYSHERLLRLLRTELDGRPNVPAEAKAEYQQSVNSCL